VTATASVHGRWRETTLGAIGEYMNGRGFKKSEWSDSGRMIIRIQDLTGSGNSPNYFLGECDEEHVVRTGDLLVSWAATLDAFIWKGREAVLNQHIFKVRSRIDSRFHYYLVKHVLADLRRKAHGSGMVHITKREFEDTPVRVPISTAEQVRIVGMIEEQFSQLSSATESMRSARGRLSKYWEAALSATLSEFAPGSAAAADLSHPLRYVTSGSRGWARYYSAEGAAFLRMENVQRSTINLDRSHIQRVRVPEIAEGKRTRLESGDIVISITADLGMVGVVPEDLGEAYVNQHLALARVRDGFHPKFVAWYLTSPQGQRTLTRNQRGATKVGLGLDDVRSVRIPQPTVGRQIEVVEILEKHRSIVDSLELELSRAERRAAVLRSTILSRAFINGPA
jgi:type I restriction enzyme S subunit